MPEVSLWDMKGLPEPKDASVPTKEEDAEETARRAAKREEFSRFSASQRASSLRETMAEFLGSGSNDVERLAKSLKIASGLEAWFVMTFMFEKCNDEFVVSNLVRLFWEKAIEWISSEKNRELAMREVKDMWSSVSPNANDPRNKEERAEGDPSPEFDRDYRFFRLSEDEDR